MKKYCPDCDKEIDVSMFFKCSSPYPSRKGLATYCKKHSKKRRKEWAKNNRERLLELKRSSNKKRYKEGYRNKWSENNKEAVNKIKRNWEKRNPEVGRRKSKKAVELLTDRYVRNKISRSVPIDTKIIPQSLIALKRLQLQIHRYIKNN